MSMRNLSFLLILATGMCHAMSTENLSDKTLKAYGQTLSSVAGSSQWQQLWQRTRAAGHFQQEGPQARFTVPMKDIPDLVSSTLRNAHDAQSDRGTQVIYRKDFVPQVVGVEGVNNLTAVCVRVDWRSLPEGTATGDFAQMGNVSLLLARPCQ
ncbi:hypothetical protein HW090_03640 [Pseudomonas sp. ABC1]|uniref:hypothetical protein n=1 Tax=Pseudomonas sp. ABC1 TaxID=2748080 RepID=UPI0015C339BD|nr:hypothetical protein [Pseudomonas sp. ABC1]QLF92340.1 hypothetical protein HW090_03640 [Pseudomonas sp. ABC1]